MKIANGGPFALVFLVFTLVCHLGLVASPVQAGDDTPVFVPEDGNLFDNSVPVLNYYKNWETGVGILAAMSTWVTCITSINPRMVFGEVKARRTKSITLE